MFFGKVKEDEMDSSLYKEISYKVQGFKVVSWLIAAVALLLCLLIGIGCYILVIGMNERRTFKELPDLKTDKITVIDDIREPLIKKKIQVDFKDSHSQTDNTEDVEPLAHLQHANKFLKSIVQEKEDNVEKELQIHPHSYKTSFSMRYPMLTAAELQTPMKEFEDGLQQAITIFKSFASQLPDMGEKSEAVTQDEIHHRLKRSVSWGFFNVMPYFSYASFGKFLYRQVSEIAEHNIESRAFQSRKLGGDPEADFLDGFWQFPISKKNKKTVKKASVGQPLSSNEATHVEAQDKPTRTAWQPLVNQVPLSFVAEILRTLLNLMKEFLMKDHVMECLWYMFCQDVNHQAKYNDVYGILARVNSVGLKVLTESEQQLRQSDTFGQVWRSVTAWTPLQCDVMFPRCDGPKALEIVNEVAMGNQ